MLLASVAAMSLAQGTTSLALSETMGKFLDACMTANQGTARKDADMTQKAIDTLTSLNMASLSESRLAPSTAPTCCHSMATWFTMPTTSTRSSCANSRLAW